MNLEARKHSDGKHYLGVSYHPVGVPLDSSKGEAAGTAEKEPVASDFPAPPRSPADFL